MELLEDDYILGVWFAVKEGFGDWMCTIKRSTSNSNWQGEYRFRYYIDDKKFNSKDKKSFYEMNISARNKEEDILKSINKLFAEIIKVYSDFNQILLIKGNTKKLINEMNKTTWACFRLSKTKKGVR